MNDKLNLTLLTDFYEFTMSHGFFAEGMGDRIAYFDMFFREVPSNGGFAIMAGVEQLIDYLKNLKFTDVGLRLPPPDKTTKSLYTMYYNDDRRKKSTIKDNAYDDIHVFFISEDMPFTDIASYNGFFRSYDPEETPVNRLDALYYSGAE